MTDTSTPQGHPPYGPNALDDVFGRLHGLSLRRDTDRRWFGGVCAGIAERVDVDPLLIRAAAIALAIAGGLGVVVYLLLWFLLPDRYDRVLAERALRQGETWPVVLGVVTALFVVGGTVSLVFGRNDWGGSLWLVIPVALVVWFVATRSRPAGPGGWSAPPPPPYGSAPGTPPAPGRPATAPPPPAPTGGSPMTAPTSSFAPGTAPTSTPAPTGPSAPPPPGAAGRTVPPYGSTPSYGSAPPYGGSVPPAPPGPPRPAVPPPPPAPRRRRPSGFVGLVSLGLVIVLGGLGVALADPVGFPGSAGILGLVLALAGVSAVVLGLGLSGRASGFSGFLALALAGVTLVATLVSHAPATRGGLGERTWMPTASSLPAQYSLGAGDATLDLSGVTAAAVTDGSRVEANIGVGELTIVVPQDLTVRIEAHTGVGDIQRERVPGPGSSGPLVPFPMDDRSGTDQSETLVVGDGDPVLTVVADLGIGDITIQEES